MLVFVRRACVAARPLLTKSVQIGTIYAVGDFTQQKLISRVKEYDYESTKRVAFVGGCVLTPFYMIWYGLLGRRLPGTSTKVVVQKIALDQLVSGGLGTCAFFIVMSILERKENIFAELKEKGPTAFMCNTLCWPFLMFVIFKKVPVEMQPIAVAFGDFLWSIFLCYYKMKDLHGKPTETDVA